MNKRRCRHVWRVRQQWWSRTNQNFVFACKACRSRWARENRIARERA